jgi:ankyrin repeat protein
MSAENIIKKELELRCMGELIKSTSRKRKIRYYINKFVEFFKKVPRVVSRPKRSRSEEEIDLTRKSSFTTDIISIIYSRLITSLKKNDTDTAEALITKRNINNLLIKAVSFKNLKVFKFLLEKGADPNTKDNVSNKPLIIYIMIMGPNNITDIKRAMFQYLVDYGADINAIDEIDGSTPLMTAVYTGDKEILKILYKHNADVNIKSNRGFTAFLYLKEQNLDFIKLFLNYYPDIDVNEKNNNGENIIMLILKKYIPDLDKDIKERIEKVKYLLEWGINIDIFDTSLESPLSYAIDNIKEIELISLLIEHQKNINLQNGHGRTPLMQLVSKSHASPGIVELLINHKADVNIQDKGGRTALMLLCGSSPSTIQIMKILIQAGADVNIQDKDGKTALMHSLLEVSSEEALKLLIDNGANLTIRSNNGKTAFDIAKEHSCPEQTLELLKP